MKIHLFVLIGMILAGAARPQIVHEESRMQATIDSQRYCQVDQKRASLVMKFSLAWKNSTSRTITIRQPVHVVPFVSRTLRDLQHSKYEFTLYAPDVFPKPGKRAHGIGPATQPTDVKPDQQFTGETMETAFPIPLAAKFSKLDALEPGRHFVQLVLGSKIQGTGTFVRITSQPIEITVEEHPKIDKCR